MMVRRLLLSLVLFATVGLPPSCCAPKPRDPVLVEALTDSFDRELFLACVEALAEQLPLARDHQVRVTPIPGYWGLCRVDPYLGHFDIQIEARQTMAGMLDTLPHEWAHAMVWGSTQEDAHDELWGTAFSRAYRVILAVRTGGQ